MPRRWTHNVQNVQALVFVAAFIPDVGERGQDLTPLPGSLIGPATLQVRPCPVASCPADVELYVDPAHFREVMAGDLSPDKTNVLAAAQRPARRPHPPRRRSLPHGTPCRHLRSSQPRTMPLASLTSGSWRNAPVRGRLKSEPLTL